MISSGDTSDPSILKGSKVKQKPGYRNNKQITLPKLPPLSSQNDLLSTSSGALSRTTSFAENAIVYKRQPSKEIQFTPSISLEVLPSRIKPKATLAPILPISSSSSSLVTTAASGEEGPLKRGLLSPKRSDRKLLSPRVKEGNLRLKNAGFQSGNILLKAQFGDERDEESWIKDVVRPFVNVGSSSTRILAIDCNITCQIGINNEAY
jgi:hypothetical protein